MRFYFMEPDFVDVIKSVVFWGQFILAVNLMADASVIVAANLQAIVYYCQGFGVKESLSMYRTLGTQYVPDGLLSVIQSYEGSKTTTAVDWEGRTGELAKKSPIEIPGDANVKIQHKAGDYDQISYKWSDGTYKYETRWYTPTPNAPEGSPNSWVIERTTPGTATGQQKVQNIYPPGVNGDWIPKWEWEAAVDAYNKGTATQDQDAILNSGHINAP